MNRSLLVFTALTAGGSLLLSAPAGAVSFTGRQTATNEWTYDLTFAALDNYSIFQPTTTITLTGLHGVVGAVGPTSTDFPEYIDAINLIWTSEVLNGGKEVRWTHFGPGTGNFSTEQNVFGFRIFANGATNGLVSLATSGFSRDTNNPLPDGSFNVDIVGSVDGPIVPEPSSLALLALGLPFLVGRNLRRSGSGSTRGAHGRVPVLLKL